MFNSVFSLPADGGEYEGWFGGFSACWTGGFSNPVPRCVPVVRQTEGPQQPQPDCATRTNVSGVYWLKSVIVAAISDCFPWLIRLLSVYLFVKTKPSFKGSDKLDEEIEGKQKPWVRNAFCSFNSFVHRNYGEVMNMNTSVKDNELWRLEMCWMTKERK